MQLRGHVGEVLSLAFHPDGERMASGGRDATIRIWNTQSGMQVGLLRGHDDAVTDLAFTSDGRTLVSASEDRTARIWTTIKWAVRSRAGSSAAAGNKNNK